jgi:hypothetical protein
MQRDVLWVGNTNIVRVRKLQDVLSGVYLNSADVRVTVLDEAGEQVSGELWPKSMGYIAGSDGGYQIALSAELDIEDGQQVTLIVDAIQSLTVGRWEIPMLCLKRANDAIG